MSRRTFWNLGWRYVVRHPWQSILMVLGITLGVAVMVAIDLANASASRAFDLSTETVAGRATHQIVGGPQGLEEGLYTQLKRAGMAAPMAPVLSTYVSSPQLGERPFQLLGVDPFAEPPFRSYLGGTGGGAEAARPAPAIGDLTRLLTEPGAVLVSTDVAERYGLSSCGADSPEGDCQITLEIDGTPQAAFVSGLLEPSDNLSRRALDNLILADIATAQELTGRIGKLDRIDVILPEKGSIAFSQQSAQIDALLPEGVRLQPVNARSGTIEQMTAAFRVNLTALSLLALVVGMFLIYNTMTFSVVQRRSMFGTLRSLGVTRREIFALVSAEALAAGLLGASLGVGLGILMGQGAVRLVTRTINDLFFVVSVQGIQIPLISLIKGFVLGVAATLFSAIPPAWEAASAPPRSALRRSNLESKARRYVRWAALGGLILLATGLGILLIPTHSLVVSFTGTFAVIIGCALLAPVVTGVLMRLVTPALGRLWGSLGRMAPRDVVNSLSRTSIAITALMVAVSVTIGVSLMVGSFRHTVIAWLDQTLQGDVYISAPSLTASRSSAEIDPAVVTQVRNWDGVQRVDVLRAANVDSPSGSIQVAATDNTTVAEERVFLSNKVPPADMWAEMLSGAVIVSEPLANRLDLPRQEASISLYTDQGLQDFPVIGVYYDYASPQGTVTMALPVYRQYWNDAAITAMGVRLEPAVQADQVTRDLQDHLPGRQRLLIRSNQTLREEVLTVFDRTFAITGALQLLATIVAFIGILSALLSLELERQRELGILRAVGLTVRQVWGLIVIETGLMGAVAGLLSMPTGYILAVILIYIINRRSFGWTLQMQVALAPFVQAMLVAVVAALLAGIYPARRMGAMTTSEAMRGE
ncbi:MAG: ABC transporter permease [Anaerolineales bacterium]